MKLDAPPDDEAATNFVQKVGISSRDSNRIEHASRVRWEWYSYGDPRTPENLYFSDYLVVGNHVEVSSNRRRFSNSYAPAPNGPAVELLDGLA